MGRMSFISKVTNDVFCINHFGIGEGRTRHRSVLLADLRNVVD